MADMALAAERGGAVGIRANGPDDIAAIHAAVQIPIIGIYKQDLSGYGIRITPSLEAAAQVVAAGASLVAVDATHRGPQEGRLPAAALIQRIKAELRVPVMADIATLDEGIAAAEAGADIVATTLSGYTAYSHMQDRPDFDLLARLVRAVHVPVIAEGRITTPQDALHVFELGGFAVVIGSMITRPRWIVQKYVEAAGRYNRQTHRVIGVDIGGTKIVVGVIDPPDTLVYTHETPTHAHDGGQEVMQRVIGAIDHAMQQDNSIAAIGVSATGEVDADGVIFYSAGHMPGWVGTQIRDEIETRFRLPVIVENDGSAAAFAEALLGAGQGYRSVLGVTVGTGVGGGFVLNRAVFAGDHRAGLTLGHICVEKNGRQCTCGKRGCLESYVSGPALVAEFNRQVSTTQQVATGEAVFHAAQAGHPAATAAIEAMCDWLGYGLGIAMNLLDPAVVVIGGGISRMGALFFEPLRQAVQRYAYPTVSQTPVLPARFGADAGMLGAAALARQWLSAGQPADRMTQRR
jgi:glucokinase-like ROK family protein